MLLSLEDLHSYYGGIHALKGIAVKVEKGSIVTLIGANGAGKSTTLRVISGLLKPARGKVFFDEQDITGLPAEKIVALGISHVPEGRRIFANLTVLENLEMGAYLRKRQELEQSLAEVFDFFPRLAERKNQLGGTLSGGEQQMLAIGRALMSKPRLLLLDEPSMGLAPILVQEIFSIIKKINEEGTTVLLVEQNAYMALNLADYAYVLETGSIALEGKAAELLQNDAVRRAYLGG
jgi:branched-chain amino acid transport system ATP-binding protein